MLEMTWPPTNPILSRSLVNYPRGNSSVELVGKFDFAVMTIPGIGCRYDETFAIKLAGIRSGMLSRHAEFAACSMVRPIISTLLPSIPLTSSSIVARKSGKTPKQAILVRASLSRSFCLGLVLFFAAFGRNCQMLSRI